MPLRGLGVGCRSALQLLRAMRSVIQSRADIKDAVVMVLRKSMFSQQLSSRLIAVNGFLYLIAECVPLRHTHRSAPLLSAGLCSVQTFPVRSPSPPAS